MSRRKTRAAHPAACTHLPFPSGVHCPAVTAASCFPGETKEELEKGTELSCAHQDFHQDGEAPAQPPVSIPCWD